MGSRVCTHAVETAEREISNFLDFDLSSTGCLALTVPLKKLVPWMFEGRFNNFARGRTKKPVGGANIAVTMKEKVDDARNTVINREMLH